MLRSDFPKTYFTFTKSKNMDKIEYIEEKSEDKETDSLEIPKVSKKDDFDIEISISNSSFLDRLEV